MFIVFKVKNIAGNKGTAKKNIAVANAMQYFRTLE